VRREIHRIRRTPHEAMPPAQAALTALGGETGIIVANGTEYSLYVYVSGPGSRTLEIAAGNSATIRLSPGDYERRHGK
jgi:phosphatidylserine decarboxylase